MRSGHGKDYTVTSAVYTVESRNQSQNMATRVFAGVEKLVPLDGVRVYSTGSSPLLGPY